MSDPHFCAEGIVQGHNPRQRISAAVEHINAHHSDNDYCIISGDLVNRGTREDYLALKRHLDFLQIPYLVMAGNHDDRALLKSVFQMPEDCMSDFVQFAIQTSEGRILCLDTQKSGCDGGEFCPIRAKWLDTTLEKSGDIPVFIFMHHPPMALGLPMQDTDRMESGEEFLDLLRAHSNVRHLFIGHVHRPICGTINGIPYATMRSVLYQAPPPQPEWNWHSFTPAHEAPNLGILAISNANVTLQYTQFCGYEVGTLN